MKDNRCLFEDKYIDDNGHGTRQLDKWLCENIENEPVIKDGNEYYYKKEEGVNITVKGEKIPDYSTFRGLDQIMMLAYDPISNYCADGEWSIRENVNQGTWKVTLDTSSQSNIQSKWRQTPQVAFCEILFVLHKNNDIPNA
jgi:hypothetical protein